MPTNSLGYYTYGVGDNLTVLYQDDDWPPSVYRFDGEGWQPIGQTFTLLDRIADGDAIGPEPNPPEGVPPVDTANVL